MITPLGTLTLAVALPGADAAATAGIAGINGALPDIQSRIAALSAFAPTPISYPIDKAAAVSIQGSIQLAIDSGIPAPSLSAQIAIVQALVTALNAIVTAVNANLTIVTNFAALLAAGGVAAYAFDGAQNVLGSELAAALGGSTAHANAIVLVTQNGATWTSMQGVFKTAP